MGESVIKGLQYAQNQEMNLNRYEKAKKKGHADILMPGKLRVRVSASTDLMEF